MLRDENKILSREVTPPSVYFNRRNFIRASILAASAAGTGIVYRKLNPVGTGAGPTVHTATIASVQKSAVTTTNNDSGFTANEPVTSLDDIAHYNNFYEFSTDKEEVAVKAANFKTDGWMVSIEGLVNKPKVFALDDILKIAPPEERVYRMRCVEGGPW